MTFDYSIRDTVHATVTYVKGSKVYLSLDNNEGAVTSFVGLKKDDRVVCSVRHTPNKDHYFYYVTVDSTTDAVA